MFWFPHRFLDIGCAPGGFAIHLLSKGLRGVGITLPSQPGAHDMDRELRDDRSGGRWRLCFHDITKEPQSHVIRPPVGQLFDVVIAGARYSKVGGGMAEEDRHVAKLMTSQLLLALRHLKPGGSLVVVLNVTPTLTYAAPLALLRCAFDDLVACKPASNFQYLQPSGRIPRQGAF